MIFCFLHCCWPLHCPKVHSLIITIVIKSRICAFRQGLEKLGDSMDIYNQPFMRLHLHKAILIPWKGDTSTRVDCLIIILTWWHCDGIIWFLIMLSHEFWFSQLTISWHLTVSKQYLFTARLKRTYDCSYFNQQIALWWVHENCLDLIVTGH